MALRPGPYPPAKCNEPKYATPEAKAHAEALERAWKQRTEAANAQPAKRIALL